MTVIYLWINAALYGALGLLCLARPTASARAIGFELDRAQGLSEFITVYGGLQLGLAMGFGLAAARTEWHAAALVASIALYTPLVLARVGSLVLTQWKVPALTLGIAALEVSLLAAAVAIWWSQR